MIPLRQGFGGQARLRSAIRHILATERTMGMGRVASVLRPGEVRLENRSERVVVAGNVTPAIGAEIPWITVNPGLLVASYNLSAGMPAPQYAMREWEQVLVGPGRAEMALRDSSGRYWAALRETQEAKASRIYSQEAGAFLSTWTVRGQGWDREPPYADDPHGLALSPGPDSWLEVGYYEQLLPFLHYWWYPNGPIYISHWQRRIIVRRVTIGGGAELTFGEMIELPDQDIYPGPGYGSDNACQDGQGYYWLVGSSHPLVDGGGYPPLSPDLYPDRPALAWLWRSDSPNDASAWTRVAMDEAYEGQLVVRAIGDNAVLFEVNIEAGPCQHRYRVGSGGSWHTLDLGYDTVLDICGGILMLLIASRQPDGSLVYRGATLTGGLLVLGDPLPLATSGQAVLHVPGIEEHWGAWVAEVQSEGEDQTLWALSHDGLPIGTTDEAVDASDTLAVAVGWFVNMLTGGYIAGRDGFLLAGDWNQAWASRITD